MLNLRVVKASSFAEPNSNAWLVDRSTPLGNPFLIGRDGDRRQVVEKYRRWLWDKINRKSTQRNFFKNLYIAALEATDQGKTFFLICHCAPQACHADVIARALQWFHSKPCDHPIDQTCTACDADYC